MLITPTIADIDKLSLMIYEMNQSHEGYSGFMSKELSSITKEMESTIASKSIITDEDYRGVISYYVNDETQSVDIAGPYVKDFDLKLGTELVTYVMNLHAKYQLNFFFDRQSKFYTSLMKKFDASYQGNETILSLQKNDFQMIHHDLNIDLIKDDEKKCIEGMHNTIFPNVYLTSSELMKEEDNKSLYVLHDDQKPIGYALIKLMKDQAFLEIFAIEKSHRGQGLGKQFISSIIKQTFDHKHINKVFLVVDDLNDIAYRLYEKIGFKIQDENVSYHIHHQI
jgi:ribosomal protein S18 acetylase RimI-like enzyme